jgi:hypothetical protein
MDMQKMLEEIIRIEDRICKAQCGKEMDSFCQEKDCRNFNIINNAYYHFDMGWINCLSMRIKCEQRKE